MNISLLFFVFSIPLPQDTKTLRIRVLDEEFYHSMEWIESPLKITTGKHRSITYDTEITEVEWFYTMVPVNELVIIYE